MDAEQMFKRLTTRFVSTDMKKVCYEWILVYQTIVEIQSSIELKKSCVLSVPGFVQQLRLIFIFLTPIYSGSSNVFSCFYKLMLNTLNRFKKTYTKKYFACTLRCFSFHEFKLNVKKERQLCACGISLTSGKLNSPEYRAANLK